MSKLALTVETYGFRALENLFKNLSELKDKKRIIVDAYKKATKPTVDTMKSLLYNHMKTGNLRNSIGAVILSDSKKIGIVIGTRIKGGYKGYHGLIVDAGTVDRYYTSKNGVRHFTGKMRYTGFVKKAGDITEKQVISTVAKEWYDAIGRYIIRSNRKKAKDVR